MNNKKHVLGLIIVVIIIAVIAVSMVIHNKLTAFSYEDHLDETVVSVDDTSISLREFGYYIYEVEAFVQDQALIYDPDNPKKWWNTHFSAGMDSTFVCDYAKKVAVNTAVCDEIYSREATGHGLSLDAADQTRISGEATEMYSAMNEYQRTVTGLDETMILEIKRKHALATKYAEYLVAAGDFSGYSGDPHDLVNWDGEYYLEVILPGYTVTQNDKLLDNITLGKVTVNYE